MTRYYNPDEPVWMTDDGRSLRMCEITDSHMENIVAYLGRLHEKTASEGMSALCFVQGEQALLAAESEIESELYRIEETREEFVQELRRREQDRMEQRRFDARRLAFLGRSL